MTYQSAADGARAWGIHGDLTDGTSPRQFEDANAGVGLGILAQALISNQINGAIGAGDLVINVDTSVGGGLATTGGVCYCEGEQITYSGIVAGVMTVIGGGRGTGGTTAAAHADNVVITQNPPLPTGHTKWLVHVPTSAALLRYDGDSTVLPIAVNGGMFAAVVRYLWFSGTPTASVNQFLGAVGLSSGATQVQRWLRYRTDLKIDMITSDIPARTFDTSVETLPRNTQLSVAITVEMDHSGGFIRCKVYYSTDGGATFTQLTWNTAGTAASVTATTLTVTPGVWATDVHVGRVVTMGGSSATVASNTPTVLTFTAAGWSAGTPAAGAFTFNAVDYVDGLITGEGGGTLRGFTAGLFAPNADAANDNGIKTYVSEVGAIHSSEYLGAYPTGFAIGKFAPNFDVVGEVEWQPNSGTDHFAAVNKEIGSGGGGIKVSETVANQQEIFGYEASDTTKIPAANTPIVVKAWGNLRASTSLPDATNLTHLVNDNGSQFTYASHDTVAAGLPKSSVSLRSMPGGGGRFTTARIDAFEAGLDKVGDDGLNYNCFQHFLMVLSVSNPRSPDPLHPTLMGMSPGII